MRDTLAGWGNERCGRLGKTQSVVHAGEVDCVLESAAHHGLFIVGSDRRSPPTETDPIMLASGVLWVKDDLRAAYRGPAHGLGIAPSFVANGDAELHAV